ncbi:MAG: hypothetical protein ABUT39_18450 [Acidobacteriota bacterium]
MNRTVRIALSMLVMTGMAGVAAGAKSPAAKPTPSAPTNVVAFAGPTLGKGELSTNQCQSGERSSFLGIDAYDRNTKEVLVLRLVIDPIEGPVVRLYKDSDSGPSLVLRKSDCSTFDYVLDSTGKSVNFVTEMKFAIQLDCRGPQGDYVVGKVDLPACL